MILKFSPAYYKSLLSWYDSQIFRTSTAASAFPGLPSIVRNDINDVDDLIQRMSSTDIVQIGIQSTSPSLAPSSHGSIPTSMAPYCPSPTPALGSASAPVAVAPLPSPCENMGSSDFELTFAAENDPPREPVPVPVGIEQADHAGIHVGTVPANKQANKWKGGNYTARSTRNMRSKKGQ